MQVTKGVGIKATVKLLRNNVYCEKRNTNKTELIQFPIRAQSRGV